MKLEELVVYSNGHCSTPDLDKQKKRTIKKKRTRNHFYPASVTNDMLKN